MNYIRIPTNQLVGRPVSQSTTAQSPEQDSPYRVLEGLAGVRLPDHVRQFYTEGTMLPGSLIPTFSDCQPTYRNYDEITKGYALDKLHDISRIERNYLDMDRFNSVYPIPRHWLTIGNSGVGDYYYLSIESDDFAPVVCVNGLGDPPYYYAESINDFADLVRAEMAIEIYQVISSCEPEQRPLVASWLERDGEALYDAALFRTEAQRRLIMWIVRLQPGWRRVILQKILRFTITKPKARFKGVARS